MPARIENPAMTIPGAYAAMQSVAAVAQKAAAKADLPRSTVTLIEIRVSQINSCAVCLDMHTREARNAGETDARLMTVAAWRESTYFSEAERAALALSEAATRLADTADPVPAEVFAAAAEHYKEDALAALVLHIALINAWNRLNVTTAQAAGEWVAEFIGN